MALQAITGGRRVLDDAGARTRSLVLALFAAFLMIGACSSPRIDTSSDEKMRASVAKVRSSLPPEKRTQFDKACVAVATPGFNLGGIMSTATAANMTSAVKERLNGRTGAEVIAAAAKIVHRRLKP